MFLKYMFAQFVVEFGWILDSMAKSYVDYDVKAQVFVRVRLVSGRYVRMLRRRLLEGTGLRSSTASSENVLVVSDFVDGVRWRCWSRACLVLLKGALALKDVV